MIGDDIFDSPDYKHILSNLSEIENALENNQRLKNITVSKELDSEIYNMFHLNAGRSKELADAVAIELDKMCPVSGGHILSPLIYIAFCNCGKIHLKEKDSNIVKLQSVCKAKPKIKAKSIEEIYLQINNTFDTSVFKLGYMPEQMDVQRVIINPQFNCININLSLVEKRIYIAYLFHIQLPIISYEDKSVINIYNKNLDREIIIYTLGRGIEEAYVIFIGNNEHIITVYTNLNLNICKKIAENIYI